MSKKGIDPVHTVSDLRQMQSLPLNAKIRMTQRRIRTWYEYWDGEVYVSFSGGKDSTVLLHIARELYPNIPAVFIDTGLEYPEVRAHALNTKNVTVLYPIRYDKKKREWVKTTFKEVLFTEGYPVVSKEIAKVVSEARKGLQPGNEGKYMNSINKLNGTYKDRDGKKSKYNCTKWKFLLDAPFDISYKCCNVMKKNPSHQYEKETGKKKIVGTLADESALRLNSWLYTGCNSFEGISPASKPLSFWREKDILEYLLRYEVDFAECYGEIIYDGKNYYNTGVSRTGCMFCGFGVHLEKEPNRYQRMKEDYPKRHEFCFKSREEGGLGFAEVMDYMGVKYE